MISGHIRIVALLMAMIVGMVLPVQAGDQTSGKPGKPAAPAAQTTTPPASGQPAAPAPTGPQPELVISEQAFDFGLVQPDTIVTHDFMVENKGRGELVIESVTPG
ncbi:MAG: hypothetical protein HQK55_08895 [Deltaproteobacteria bacterium]|nr:hypothetical protein [Deltaproteobacteria bacterium]